jgi:imidazoleglycerol phosphate synthase glutamine amidotransferase subunit HisH
MKIIPIILACLLIAGCMSISQEQAEAKALRFVRQRVKFFVSENGTRIELPEIGPNSVTSFKEDKLWVVVVHVSASVDSRTKDSDMTIEVNARTGDIISFNGQQVNRQ